MQIALLGRVGLDLSARELARKLRVGRSVARVGDVEEGPADKLVLGVAEELREARVHPDQAPVQSRVDHAHSGLFEGGAEGLLSLAELGGRLPVASSLGRDQDVHAELTSMARANRPGRTIQSGKTVS